MREQSFPPGHAPRKQGDWTALPSNFNEPAVRDLADHEYQVNDFVPACAVCQVAYALHPPTVEQIAASIGVDVDKIDRTVRNAFRASTEEGAHTTWVSFVDTGDPDRLAVFETIWPQD